jgi:uncharacterized membrane protein (DUF485 family)
MLLHMLLSIVFINLMGGIATGWIGIRVYDNISKFLGIIVIIALFYGSIVTGEIYRHYTIGSNYMMAQPVIQLMEK